MKEQINKLKPCPFCGGNDLEVEVWDDDYLHIVCYNCNCFTDSYDKYLSRALRFWNTRTAPDETDNGFLTCPLCGSHNIYCKDETVYCKDCKLTIRRWTKEQAVTAWNRRACE